MLTLKIKYALKHEKAAVPINRAIGDWFDLQVVNSAKLGPLESFKFSLGFAMELPKGYVARISPRSSLYIKKRLMLANSEGKVDNTFKGDRDIWHVVLVNVSNTITTVKVGDALVQMEIGLSPKATMWQKIKHLLYSKIEFIEVPLLNNNSRGGYGTTNGYN